MNNEPEQLNQYLFIGGSRDGMRIGVPNYRQHEPMSVELPALAAKAGPAPGPRRKNPPQPTEFYVRMQFSGETEAFVVFVLKGVSGNSVLRALIEGYGRPDPKEGK